MDRRTESDVTKQRQTAVRARSGQMTGEPNRSWATPTDEQRDAFHGASPSIGRRELLGAIGTAAAAGLAGCSGGGGGSSGPPISQPTTHAQDMTLSIVQDGSSQLEQNVHLEFDDPDFLMDVQMGGFDGTQLPMPGYRFVRVDGTVYLQMMGFCYEANQDADDVQAMAATPERFDSYGGLEQKETTTIDGVEVEVWKADVDDLPLDQMAYQPESSAGGDMGGRMPGGGDFEAPAYLDPDGVQEGTLKVWIGTENGYLRQAEQTAVFDAGDAEYRFDMTAENYDFGEDFTIEAPPNCGDGGGGFGG